MDEMVSREEALEALQILNRGSWHESTQRTVTRKHYAEILQRYIEPDLDEWCEDCKEYDRERHCCPRFNRVIRETVDEVKETAEEDAIHDEYVRLHTPEVAALGLLCEECGEVVKAAAKLERILRKESPTPETEEEWREKLHEEINDVFNIARVLGLKEDHAIQRYKMNRWCERIKSEEESNV